MPSPEPQYQSPSGCLLRLFWLFLGNGLLGIVAFQMITSSPRLLSLLDVTYWVFVGLILCARYVDIRYFGGTKADGQPASLQDFRRHALILLAAAAVVWLVVHLLAAA